MKLSSIVDRATISPLTWDYNCLDEAVVAETIVVGDDTYHLVIELDGGHGVWYDGGNAGEPSYLHVLAECHEYPSAVRAWLADAQPETNNPAPGGQSGQKEENRL